jgi:hypothetical protein
MKAFINVFYNLKHLAEFCATYDLDDVLILYHSQENNNLEVLYNLWIYFNDDSSKFNAQQPNLVVGSIVIMSIIR